MLLIDGQGRSVDRSEADRALKRVWQILEEAMEYSTKRTHDLLPSASLYNYFIDSCHRAFRSGDMSQREVDLVQGMAEMWGAYVGDRCDLQSLKFFYLEDCINGGKHDSFPSFFYGPWLIVTDDCFIPTNYRKIISRIAALPLQKANIQFNTMMVSVEACADGPLPVCITTSNGNKQCFDDVVGKFTDSQCHTISS